MYITRLRLQNIKSYTDATIEFKEGINGIIGENGHGKTTILEAIGYALFDYLPIDIKDFIRKGEKWGEVQLWFILDDELEYQIRKGVGRSVFEVRLPTDKVLRTRRDCEEWILGTIFPTARDPKDVKSLFTNILGVPQGQFTQAFSATPTARKEAFDRILRLDEYRQVFEALKAVPSGIKEDIEVLERDIKRLEGLSDGCQANRQALEEVKVRRADAHALAQRTAAELASAKTAYDGQEALRKRSEAIQMDIDRMSREMERMGGTLTGSKANLLRRNGSKNIADSEFERYEQYNALHDTLEQVRKQLEHALKLDAKAGGLEDKARTLEEGLKELEGKLERVLVAQEFIKKNKDVPKRYSELEASVKRLTKDVTLFDEKTRVLAGKKKEAQTLMKSASMQQELSVRFEGAKKGAECLDVLREDLARLEHEIEGHKSELLQIQGFKDSLGEGQCPFLKRDCPAVEGDLNDYFEKRTKAIQTEMAPKAKDKSKLKKGLEAAAKAAEDAHRIELELSKSRDALSRLDALSAEIGRLETDIKTLDGAKKQMDEAQKDLDHLRPDLESFNKNALIASDEEAVVKSITAQEAKRKDVLGEARSIRTELAGYKDVKDRKEAAEKKMKELEPHHKRYIEAKALYDRFAGIEEEIAALEARMTESREQSSAKGAEMEELGFDRTALTGAQEALSNAQRDLAVAMSRMEGLDKEMKERAATVARQEDAIARISMLNIDITDKKELQNFVEFVRDTIRDCGPLIGTRMIGSINETASEMYCEIISDHSQVLEWTRDYDIIVGASGQERSFRQLSGGEQMAAALAVRLAMLKTLARSDLVFLDEPTQNLDDERRRNLAQQIRSVRGFKQMFVITHDDTFSQDYGYIIRVSKVGGETSVEYGSKDLTAAPADNGTFQETI